MEKNKRVPFDLETAKKIQAGGIEGKIRTERGEKVLLYENDSDKFKCWIHEERDGIHIAYGDREVLNLLKLYIEVPDNDLQFKPFDKVLVRDSDNEKWTTGIFSHIEDNEQCYRYVCSGNIYMRQCIKFEGNEHLLGTTDNPKEE